MTSPFGDDLPRPAAGRLHVYLLGPGVGESEVVVFPDGRCMVVDGCTHGGVNLPAALLEHLGIASIDALVLTHPDLDHVRGVADVVRRFTPRKLFRYPALGYVRDFVAMWHEAHPTKARYRELAEAIAVLDEHADLDGTDDDAPCASTRPWTPKGAPYKVHFLAPTPFDRDRVRLVWRKIVELRAGRYVLSRRFERLMSGETRLGDAPNAVSLGLVVEWAGRKILLAGDVENGKRSSPKSGWKGVLRLLDDPDDPRGHLVDDVDLVKVAHHGSTGAFFPGAWERHARSRRTTAILAPFAPSSLPSDQTLVDLRRYCGTLGISAGAGEAFERARAAGWVDVAAPGSTTKAPCIAAVLDPTGGLGFFRDGAAALFQRRATYADLKAVPSGKVAELIQGILHVMPRPAPMHANAASGPAGELRNPYHRGRGGPGGWWILIEPEIHFPDLTEPGETDVVVPDVAGWRRDRMRALPDIAYFTLAPDWICEVLSKSTNELDRKKKMPLYARHGVRHAWLIDPIARTLEIFTLGEDRQWSEPVIHRGVEVVRAVPFDEIDLDLSALWT